MLTSLSTEDLIPADHPIRKIRVVADAVLAELDPVFDEMYATGGRRSVPPEQLLKSTVLMAMYHLIIPGSWVRSPPAPPDSGYVMVQRWESRGTHGTSSLVSIEQPPSGTYRGVVSRPIAGS